MFSSIRYILLFLFLLSTSYLVAQTGPGGVGANTAVAPLQVWLKADAITPIPVNGTATDWTDASGYGRHARNTNGGGNGVRAVYQANIANTFPIIRFNGLNTTAGAQYNDAYSYSARTVLIVFRESSTTQVNDDLAQLWGDYTPSQAHIAADARAGSNVRGFSFDGAGSSQARYSMNGNNFTGFAGNSNVQQWVYDQFQLVTVEFQNAQAMTNQRISTLASSFTTEHRFGGDIAEIVVYDRVLNPAERIVVQNYLSAKYNVPLTQNDFYAHDATTAQPYFHQVIGVGKVTGTDVHLTSASSFLEVNAVSTISNNSYLFLGHDNGAIAAYSTTNVPSGFERVARTWRADVTGTVGTVTFRVDISQLPVSTGCQLYIFTDADNNFTAGATSTALTQVGTSSIYEATVSITDNAYLTVGQAAGSSVTLTATATGNSGEVNLTWTNPSLVNFQEYRIYGGLSANPTNLLATVPTQTTLSTVINGLTDCRRYYFRLVPVTLTNNESPCEGTDTVIPVDGAPPAAMNLTNAAPVTTPSPNGQITLTFDPSGDTEIDQIRVYRYVSGDPVPATPTFTFTSGITPTTTQVIVAGLFASPTPPTTCYRITQVDRCGQESALSQEQCAIISVQPEICNNSIDDDGDGNIDCGDPDCAGVDGCPGCIYQITDPGVFQLFQFKVVNVCGEDVGYQTPIFGDIDNDGQTEIIVMGDNGCISVVNPRLDSNPDIEHTQSNLIRASQNTSLLTMADVDNNGYIDFFYAIERSNGSAGGNPIARYEYRYDVVGPNKFVLVWATDDPAVNPTASQRVSNTFRSNTNLTDFNEDGIPEVYTGGTIFNAVTGQFLAYVGAGNPDGNPRNLGASEIFHISNAADVLSSTDLIDTNNDGIVDAPCGAACNGLELLAGNVVYSVDFTQPIGSRLRIVRRAPTPTYSATPTRSTSLPTDATMSVADMDNDGDIDAVVSGFGKVYVWDIQDPNPATTLLSNIFDLRGYTNAVTLGSGAGVQGVGGSSDFSGIPTINDFDDDGINEFGVTKELGVVMFDDVDPGTIPTGDLVPLWTLSTTDNSGTTGLSSFDFLGTGLANLVYRDETKVRVFQGDNGNVYFDSQAAGFPACNSGTGMEVPTIGDVNDDGQTEIVASCDGRIIIYQSSNVPWLPSRDVWNQVNYNITNIRGDLAIPTTISPQNYQTIAPPLNNYMAQRPLSNSTTPFIPAADIVALVDIDDGAIDLGNCPAEVTFTIDIENQGDADVLVQYPITFYSGNPQGSSWSNLQTFSINDNLLVGEQREYTYSFPLTNDPTDVYVVLNDAGTSTAGAPVALPNTSVAECEYDNNYLGPYTISSCFDPLPVSLVRFSGKDEEIHVRLDWITSWERSNRYFEIERSTNGSDFISIGTVMGNGTTNQTNNYVFYDNERWTGTAYYRLKQVDIDNSFTYSNTIYFSREWKREFRIYPNPISNHNTLNIEGLEGKLFIDFYDATGRKVRTQTVEEASKGLHQTPIDNLSKGLYILTIRSESQQFVHKLIIE